MKTLILTVLMSAFAFFALEPLAFAQNEVTGCSANLIEKLEYQAGRAEKICNQARKVGTDTFLFSSCVIDIHTETKLAPELIAPYCMKRPDPSYKDCVVATFKSNSKENSFKSCLKKSSLASLKRPEKVKISVANANSSHSLED